MEEIKTRLSVTFQPLGDAPGPGAEAPEPAGRASVGRDRVAAGETAGPAGAQTGAPRVLLLVVRVTHGPVGPMGMDLAGTKPFALDVCQSLAGTVLPVGTHTVPVAEWRLGLRDADGRRSRTCRGWRSRRPPRASRIG